MDKIDPKEEMAVMKDVVANLKESDFVSLPDSYGNIMSVMASDFKDLAKEGRGSDVMFVVRGAIKGNAMEMEDEEEESDSCIEIYLFDCALVHGKKSMRLGGGGKFEAGVKALEKKGYSKDRASAIMASAGRAKYGKKKFQSMAKTGLRRYYREK